MISSLGDLQTMIWLACFLTATGVGLIIWAIFFYRKERRLFRNIRRPILVVGTADKPMDHEANLLKQVGLFNIQRGAADARARDMIGNHRLVIVGYSRDSEVFERTFKASATHQVPVIVFANQGDISDEDMTLIQDYTYQSICNTPLRLVSDVFALMSTFPEVPR